MFAVFIYKKGVAFSFLKLSLQFQEREIRLSLVCKTDDKVIEAIRSWEAPPERYI